MDGAKPLWEHQIKAIEKARSRDSFALFFDMGTGKTRTTIEIIREHYNNSGRIMRTLILCPPIVMKNWKDEFKKFSKIPQDRIILLSGSQRQRVSSMRETDAIYILNYEGLLMEDLYSAIYSWKPEILVCDESHKLKSFTAKRTKQATRLSDVATFRYILSGTPITNSYLDLFSQFRILDHGKSFGTNFYSFRAKYFVNANAFIPKLRAFPNWKIRPGSEKIISNVIADNSMRVKKEDCIDLPDLVVQDIEIDLSPKQRAIYDQMEEDFIAFFQEGVSVAKLAITKALRLQQIVSGFVKLEGDKILHFEENPRSIYLKEFLEEVTPEHKVIVWACFKENYTQIRKVCDDLGLGYVEVHGDVSSDRKFDAVERFNKEPGIRVFIGNPGAGGIGINLVSASYSVFYSRDFNAEHYWQAGDRNYRGGSHIHSKITRINLIASNTLDEKIAEALQNKTNISEAVLKDLVFKRGKDEPRKTREPVSKVLSV